MHAERSDRGRTCGDRGALGPTSTRSNIDLHEDGRCTPRAIKRQDPEAIANAIATNGVMRRFGSFEVLDTESLTVLCALFFVPSVILSMRSVVVLAPRALQPALTFVCYSKQHEAPKDAKTLKLEADYDKLKRKRQIYQVQ
jgi:hypothetical protein